jgi:hypothetical protein
LLTAAGVALTLACGGSEPAGESTPATEEPAAAPSVDVCGLLTAADIEAAVGRAAGEAAPGTSGLGECTWPSADGSVASLVHLELDEAKLDSYEDFIQSYLRDFGEEPSRERHREVQGIGDWAMYEEDDHALRVYVGDRVLVVGLAAPAGEEQALGLAEKAVPRLP